MGCASAPLLSETDTHQLVNKVKSEQGTSCGYNMCWTFTNYSHLLCGLCHLRWYWASMPVERTLPCWLSPKIAFRLSSEAGAHAQLAHAAVDRIDSSPRGDTQSF